VKELRSDKNWDRTLGDWPEAETTEPEDRVRAVTEAIARGGESSTSELSDDDLFASPLPRSSDDADEERERGKEQLTELARMAQDLGTSATRRAVEARKDDSGIVDLAAAAKADPEGEVRAKTTPLAEHDLVEAPPEAEASESESEREREGGPKSEPRPKEKEKPNVIVGLFVTSLVALGAAAAIGFLYVETKPPVATNTAKPILTLQLPGAATASASAEAPPAATAASDPNSLPAAPAKLAEAPKTGGANGTKPTAPSGSAGDSAKLALGALGKGDTAPREEEARGATGPNDLGAALRKEMGDDTKDKTPAAALTNGADLPQRPSQGAVTGALGTVLPEARRCLGPDDPVSRAAIVFTSNGSVQSVAVTGPAEGKASETCIKAALSKAKVKPFAEPTFTANITIRHL
jgi:hypothetical protein